MHSIIFFSLLLVDQLYANSDNNKEFLRDLYSQNKKLDNEIIEDALLETPDLIEKYGYPVEKHEVRTDDDYLLILHRIPYGRVNISKTRTPILLMHGLLMSSADWIINGPEKSLGYLLADEGYDVWMGNARGNVYSRKHIKFNCERDPKYWKFSWHEIGIYDIPAMIDYILRWTEKPMLQYIGFSQGTTSFFVMASEKPEYNNKIKLMQALSPIAFLGNAESPFLKTLASFEHNLDTLTSLIGADEFLPSSNLTQVLALSACNEESLLSVICTNILFLASGYDPEQLNKTMLPVYASHTPAGSSTRQLIHYLQLYKSKRFRQYDHGFLRNLHKYFRFNPPDYKLKNINAPVYLYCGQGDYNSNYKDVRLLYKGLPNLVGLYIVPYKNFSHLDFLWGIDAKELLYDWVINTVKYYDEI